jgi:hypothetical protein
MCAYITLHMAANTLRQDCELVTRNVPIDANFFAPLRTIVVLQDNLKGEVCGINKMVI